MRSIGLRVVILLAIESLRVRREEELEMAKRLKLRIENSVNYKKVLVEHTYPKPKYQKKHQLHPQAKHPRRIK